MAEEGSGSDAGGTRARRTWTIIIVALAIIAVVVAVWLTVANGESGTGDPTGSPSDTPSASASASASPEPSEPGSSASPLPSASPTEDAVFPELDPVEPEEEVDAEGIVIRISKLEHVEGEAVAPGDVAGAAVRLTLTLTNDTDADFRSSNVAVNAYVGPDRTPTEPFEQPGGVPFSETVAPGDSTTGVYLFRVAEDERDDVTVTVDYQAGSPAVVFQGSLASEW